MTIPASVHVTKLAAANRQLRASIRLYFQGEDELAIHTIAAAAYALISDLKAARGMDEAADVQLAAFFYVIRDFHRGALPDKIAKDAEAIEWIQETADRLPINADTLIGEVSAEISLEFTRQFWKDRNRIANFLKHADRDAGKAIALKDVDNFTLLMQSLTAYTDLGSVDDLGIEGVMFWLYFCVETGDTAGVPEKYKELLDGLVALESNNRSSLCSKIIEDVRNAKA